MRGPIDQRHSASGPDRAGHGSRIREAVACLVCSQGPPAHSVTEMESIPKGTTSFAEKSRGRIRETCRDRTGQLSAGVGAGTGAGCIEEACEVPSKRARNAKVFPVSGKQAIMITLGSEQARLTSCVRY